MRYLLEQGLCMASAPEIQISTSPVGFYTKKKAEEETFLLLFFLSSFSWDLPSLDTPKISPFLLCYNERISPKQDAAEADAQRKNVFSTALMSTIDKDFGGILTLFFQTLQCGFGFSEPLSWHCSLRFLPPIQPAVNCFYQRRVILFSSPVSDLPVSH